MNNKKILEMHEKMLYPTVRVRTDETGGSGTVIYSEKTPNGEIYESYVLTNHHVIDDAIKIEDKWNSLLGRKQKTDVRSQVSVEFFDFEYDSWEAGQITTKADIVEYNKDMDVALLRLKRTKKVDSVATLFPKGKEKERLKMFMEVFAIGCGLGHPPLATQGQLTGFNDFIKNYPFWLQTGQTIFGNSGGAVYLADTFEFIGIPARIALAQAGFSWDAITHMSFFIPITTVYEFIDQNLLYFLYDESFNSKQCETLRKAKRKDDDKELLKSESIKEED